MSTTPALSLSALSFVVLLASNSSAQSPASGRSRPEQDLILEAIRTIVVPANFKLGGVYLAGRTAAVAWSVAGPDLMLINASQATRLSFPGSEAAASAGIGLGGQTISVLLLSEPQVLTLSRTGQLLKRIPLTGVAPGEEFVAAAFNGRMWAVAFRTGAGDCRIGIVRADGSVAWLVTLQRKLYVPALPDTNARFAVHVGWHGDRVTATSIWPPFASVIIAPTGSIERTLQPGMPAPHGDADEVLWASLPLLRLDSGWIQELTNLKGNERMLVRYSEAGEVVRRKPFDAVVGIIATMPKDRTLAATLRTNGAVLTLYSWRWQ